MYLIDADRPSSANAAAHHWPEILSGPGAFLAAPSRFLSMANFVEDTSKLLSYSTLSSGTSTSGSTPPSSILGKRELTAPSRAGGFNDSVIGGPHDLRLFITIL